METTRLSSKGQVIIPKAVRQAHRWEVGQEFTVVDIGDGVLLRAQRPFAPTQLHDVVRCLVYEGPAKSLDELEQAVAQGVGERCKAEASGDHT